jgi:hypothetical protein
MIIPMTTTGRPQQRYDHRLRDLVLSKDPIAPNPSAYVA